MDSSSVNASQPLPLASQRHPVWQLVLADIDLRNLLGIERYGTPLQAFNGRNAVLDAYQEALDNIVYLRQAVEEWLTYRELLNEAHGILDGLNNDAHETRSPPRGRNYSRCRWCGEKGYDVGGIKHLDSCILIRMRATGVIDLEKAA